jgi:hypothetical protein
VNRPFFIVGSGRSGTTLLRMVLSGHPRLCIPPETWFLLDLVAEYPLLDALTPAQVDDAVARIVANYRWPDLEIDPDAFAASARSLERPTIRGLADLIYGIHAERDGAERWGDKTPTYVRIVPELARLYPDALFIHLLRDGHDVALSFHGRRWKGRWLAWNAREWTEAIDFMRAHRRTLPAERLMEVRYEDLVLDTEGVTRRICAFLGEDFHPGMLEWAGSVTDKVPERELGIHQDLFRKPRPEDNHRWRSKLSASRTFVLESYIGSRLRGEGYPVRFASPVWRPALAACRIACVPILPTLDVLIRIPGAVARRVKWVLGLGPRPGAPPAS